MTAYAERNSARASAWYLVAGPVMGLVYVVVLPFIAIGTVITIVGGKMVGGLVRAAARLSFGWRPSEAYLSGKKKKN